MLIRLLAVFLLFVLALSTQAREVAGITLPERVKLNEVPTELQLNGAGVRSKFIFDIYVGALYLTKQANTVKDVINMPGPKRVHMHFLYDEVSKEKLVGGWNSGFENNLTEARQKKLTKQLQHFNSLFKTTKKGDVIDLDFKPGVGTEVWINNELQGKVAGDEFYPALLMVWLGEDPADGDLKQGMLGQVDDDE